MTPTFLQVPMEPKKLAQFCTSQICLCMKLYAVQTGIDWEYWKLYNRTQRSSHLKFVTFNMKQFCMFVGMSIIHDHNKCHTTSWIYSVLIVLTTNEQNYIQNSHVQSVLHTIYINTYIYTYSVVQQFHLRFSHSHLLVRNPHNLKLQTSSWIPVFFMMQHTHTPHSHNWAYTLWEHKPPFPFKEHELKDFTLNPGSFKKLSNKISSSIFWNIVHISKVTNNLVFQ